MVPCFAQAGNRVEETRDASAHAELLALRAAASCPGRCALAGLRPDCNVGTVSHVRPALTFFRIRRLIFGAYDPKGGGVEHGARVFEASSCPPAIPK